MADRENYFILLDLDPRVSDPAAIEARIREKQLEWSRDASTGVGRKASDANRHKAMLGDIRQVLLDRSARAAEAAAAQKLREAGRGAAEAALAQAIAVICAGGSHTAEQLKRLQNQFRGSFEDAEIAAQLARGCPPAAPRAAAEPLETISTTDQAACARDLAVVGKRDLYDFLGAGRTVPAATLYAEADRRNRDILARNQTTPEATAAKNLCGLAMKLFHSEAGRARYDNTLAGAVIGGMRDLIALSVQDGRIARGALDRLINQAAAQGMDRALAHRYIDNLAAERGWRLDDGAPLPSADKPQCAICGAIAATVGQRNCAGCGHPFEIPCFACGKAAPVGAAACPHCGAGLADAALLLQQQRAAETAVAGGDWPGAEELCQRILARQPSYAPARALAETMAGRRGERDQAASGVLALVSAQRLCAARDALAQARERFGVGFGGDDLARRIAAGLQRADQAAARAAAAQQAGRVGDAFDAWREALDLAADHPDALRALARMPPPPPGGLTVTAGAAGVVLDWPAISARGEIRYRLIGQADRPPAAADPPADATAEGYQVTETAATGLTDTGVPVGRAWYYALYSVRAGVTSTTAAHSGPHLRTAEVGALRAEPGAGGVTLHWTPPPHCLEISARRLAGEVPRSMRDGEPVTCDLRGLHDSGLLDGRTYGYRIAVRFADPRDPRRQVTTDGLGITARPTRPPPPIEDLTASRADEAVLLRFTPPAEAGVLAQLRRATGRPALAPGSRLPLTQADQVGTPLPLAGPGQARLVPIPAGAVWITPLSVRDAVAVVGRAVLISNVADVTGLKAQPAGTVIQVSWDWPAGAAAARLCLRLDGYPDGPDDPRASRVDILRDGNQPQHDCTLPVAGARPHYLGVYARAADGQTWSAGVRHPVWFGQQPSVGYRVRIRHNLWRRITAIALELRADERVTEVRDLVLVVGRGQLPLSPAQGQVIDRWERVRFVDGQARLAIPAGCWGRERYARLFFATPDADREVRLMPGEKAEMRLG